MSSHETDKTISQGLLQTELAGATTEAQRKTALINHHLRMITAARTYHVRNGSMTALVALGGTPPAGSWTADDS
jgi:hypothetical protein